MQREEAEEGRTAVRARRRGGAPWYPSTTSTLGVPFFATSWCVARRPRRGPVRRRAVARDADTWPRNVAAQAALALHKLEDRETLVALQECITPARPEWLNRGPDVALALPPTLGHEPAGREHLHHPVAPAASALHGMNLRRLSPHRGDLAWYFCSAAAEAEGAAVGWVWVSVSRCMRGCGARGAAPPRRQGEG